MKFDTRALQILRNFSTINQSIIFKPGKEIRTIAPSKSIFATAKISTEVDMTFAIYDLAQLLSNIGLYDDPEITLYDNYLTIGPDKQVARMPYSDTSLIIAPPSKEMKIPSVDVSFKLNSEALGNLIKFAGINNLPEISLSGDGKSIYAIACNSKNSSDSNMKSYIGETDKDFALYFLIENLNILPGEYKVDVCSQGIAQFSSEDLTYWIAVEKNSKFPE